MQSHDHPLNDVLEWRESEKVRTNEYKQTLRRQTDPHLHRPYTPQVQLGQGEQWSPFLSVRDDIPYFLYEPWLYPALPLDETKF